MKRVLKTCLSLLCLVVVFLLVAVLLPDRYYKYALNKLGPALGTGKLAIAGLAITRTLSPTVRLQGLNLDHKVGEAGSLHVAARDISINIHLPSLIRGILQINQVTSQGIHLSFKQNAPEPGSRKPEPLPGAQGIGDAQLHRVPPIINQSH